MLGVENRIRMKPDPVAQVNIPATTGQRNIQCQMTMTKNEVVDISFRKQLFAILYEPFLVFSQKGFSSRGCTALPAEKVGYSYTP